MKTDWFHFSYSHFTVIYRQHGDLIEAFKILNDFTNVQMGAAFTLNTTQFTMEVIPSSLLKADVTYN